MWAIAVIMGVSIIIIEIPLLMKRKKKKEIWAFSFLLLTGTILCAMALQGIEVPTPLEWIRIIYEPMGKSIEDFLKAGS